MYYPFVRGKQFELILLRDNAKFLAENSIHPIIEPVKEDFTALTRAMKALHENNVSCTLIINPKTGLTPVSKTSILKNLIDDVFKDFKNLSIGFMLHAESNTDDLVALLKKYKKNSFSIIHCGFTNSKKLASEITVFNNIANHIFIDGFAGKLYQKHLTKEGIKKILIRNGFKPQKKNAAYPPTEHFSDLHITYEMEGMDGFGDFLIVGDDYTETGGPAYAVAIHLTYLDDDDDMFIYHFISDQTDSPTDPGGKFLEALDKLVKSLEKQKSKIFKSKACIEFHELYLKKHYPGLGYVKKLSMQHHLELIADLIKRSV